MQMIPTAPNAAIVTDPIDPKAPIISDKHWQEAMDQWSATLDSEATKRNYRATIAALFSVPGMVQEIAQATPDILTAWRGALVARSHRDPSDTKHIAASTVNRHLSAARNFFNYWRALSNPNPKEGVMHVTFSGDAQRVALASIKAHVERPYQILAEDETGAMLTASSETAPITDGRDRIGRQTWQHKGSGNVERDGVIIETALATGLRCAELAALNIGDLVNTKWKDKKSGDMCKGWYVDVKHGKGNRQRQVWISDDDAATLRDYITASGRNHSRASDSDTPMFLSTGNRNRSGRMSVNHIRRVIDAAADRAQAAGTIRAGVTISPHSLRHTYAIDLLTGDEESGRRPATVPEVQALLGHASIATTQRYLDHINSHARASLTPSIAGKRRRYQQKQSS